MFLEQGIKKSNGFGKYLLGSLVIFVFSNIGQIPLLGAVYNKSVKENLPFPVGQEDFMRFLDSNLTLFLLLISFVFALLGVYLVVKYLHNQTFLSVTTSRNKMDWSRFFFSFSLWSVFTIITTLLIYYFSPEDFIFNFKPIPFAILAVIGIILIPIQTSTEEYVFRGYLMQGFANLAKNRWFPLLMTSMIFGLLHIANPEVEKMGYIVLVYYIGTGLFLGVLTLMDEGLELSLGFHAANNLVSALLVSSEWSVFQTNSIFKDISNPSAGLDVVLPVVLIYPILLFIFSQKYNWTNWKEKLTGKINVPNQESSFNS